ncbi:SlyX family protein [Nostoc sp. C052]|uniref:hypothetical protein n=1 Tax=Nostoc sp. C052 TaxID=2576902 RepID=UPI0015C2EF05|nr:hypothetical protein [Nostoc sp. C052]QLE40814.1 SlyX family protein [Nostoc sp. C052]
MFNSGLLNRLEDFGFSKDGGFTAKFKELKQEVNEQKKQIDELQAQQLEQLVKQQNNLEETQAFMFGFCYQRRIMRKFINPMRILKQRRGMTFMYQIK